MRILDMSISNINSPFIVNHWINGAIHPNNGDRNADVLDPAFGKVVRRVNLATKSDVDNWN